VEKDLVPDTAGPFGKALVEIAEKKLNRNDYRNKVWGYGKVCL
jgi:hypothetical protein